MKDTKDIIDEIETGLGLLGDWVKDMGKLNDILIDRAIIDTSDYGNKDIRKFMKGVELSEDLSIKIVVYIETSSDIKVTDEG